MKYTSEDKSNQKPTWQEILRDAEISPPDSLWEAIEAQLPEEPSRKILPIWWSSPILRVASAVFLVLGITTAIYMGQSHNKNTGSLTQRKVTPAKEYLPAQTLAQVKDENEHIKNTLAQSTKEKWSREASVQSHKWGHPLSLERSLPIMEIDEEQLFVTMALPQVVPLANREWEDYGSRFTTNKRRFLPVPVVEVNDHKEEKRVVTQKSWVQVGGGISPFNPQLELADFPSVASTAVLHTVAQNKLTSSNQGTVGGVSIAGTPNGPTENNMFETLLTRPSQTFRSGMASQWAGIVGKQLTPRWQLETGIRWMNGRATTTGNVFAFDESTGDIQPFFESSYFAQSTNNRSGLSAVLSATEQTDVSFQYIALPVQVGYIMPLATHWQAVVYTGISTDFFRNYGRQLEGEIAEKVFQPSNSQFRAVTWSGVAGVRIARTFQQNWQVSVGAQIQESLASGIDSQSNATFRPRMFGVQYGLGYVF